MKIPIAPGGGVFTTNKKLVMGTIPKQAKCVFKGIIFDVYQWQQKMFDGSYATFEMLKRLYTVQVIATKGDKILIAEEEQSNLKRGFGLLGGRIDKNEEPLEAAKRELPEESGMRSDNWKPLKYYEPHNKTDYKIYYFIARDCKRIAEPKLENREKITIREVSFEEFIKIMLSDDYKGGEFKFDLFKLYNDKAELAKFRKTILGQKL